LRADVQALRALAVAGVVLYHLWPHVLRGGFVGVDVFFVISGFLITRHLVDEMRRTGRISLRRFWARRIRRILPAALTVLAACVAMLLLAMPRVTWQGNLDEIRAAAAYFENWLLGVHSVDYLAAENAPSLVQHYWSLSVEEQFYLCWPLLLLLPLMAARSNRVRLRLWLIATLLLVAAGSLVVSVTWTASNPPMAFFATPTRAWEFAVGGLVGTLVRPASGDRGRMVRTFASWAGIAAIGYAYVGISSADPFPGWIAVVPVLGAAVFIAAQTPDAQWSIAPAIRPRAVQWTGDNSYAIYLWHWPLIIAAPWVIHHATTNLDRVAILALSLALAGITKRLVEDPVRTGTWWQARVAPAYALAAVGIAALVVATSTVSTGARHAERQAVARAKARTEQQTQALVAAPAERSCYGASAILPVNHCARPFARPAHLDPTFAAADGRSDPCLEDYDAATPTLCVLGATHPKATIALVGNSHAWRLVPALTLYGERHGWRIVVATRINCLGLTTQPIGSGGASPNCLQWSADVQQRLLAMPRLDAVIFAGYRFAASFVQGISEPPSVVLAARQQVLDTWSTFRSHGIHVIVTGDVPGMRPTADPDCLAQSSATYDPCAVDRASVVKPNLMSTVARANPQVVSYIPLTKYFCDARKCHAVIGGVVVYFDSHHLTTTYSRSLARYIGPQIAAAMAKPVAP
jgi:peptidoglycan/LPS O-acetylase OafA/YrhL